MNSIITFITTVGVVLGGYPISIPFTNDTAKTVPYNLIDTDPSCYHRGLCPNFFPGGKLSTFPNSEEKYQHILHNMFRQFGNQSLDIKFGKWVNGADEDDGPTYYPQYCDDLIPAKKPLYWYSDANQAARFKQWDFNTCNKSWYIAERSVHDTCKFGEAVIDNVPIDRCSLFSSLGELDECSFSHRSETFCQEDGCWFETESICSGNKCLVIGPVCDIIFKSRYDYSGAGFVEGYDGVTTVYSRYTKEISYLLPSGAHFDERRKIVQEDYNRYGKHFTLWLQYFDVNKTQAVEACYSLYDGNFHAMNLLVGSRMSENGEFYSAMFTSNHLPPSQCEPYAFICKTTLGNYFRLPEDRNYYFGTEWIDGNNSDYADFGLDCKENHYFYDQDESEWIVNGGPTLNKSHIWYYQDTINYGQCIGCEYIDALECWSQCILNNFSEEFCLACMDITTTTAQPTIDPTEIVTSMQPTINPTSFPTSFPTALPTAIPSLITTMMPTIDLTEISTTFEATEITTTEIDAKVPCKRIRDCDIYNGYQCKIDPVCLGKKWLLFCAYNRVCLKKYRKCSCNNDCEGDHECVFKGGIFGYGVCIQYQ